ncbi:MAG: hypothetical protein PHU75_09970 [Candidatus Nanopelagicales bacterium]|nr:hypothetical protein [Candidatus Nanopelagicales bacterium]
MAKQPARIFIKPPTLDWADDDAIDAWAQQVWELLNTRLQESESAGVEPEQGGTT